MKINTKLSVLYNNFEFNIIFEPNKLIGDLQKYNNVIKSINDHLNTDIPRILYFNCISESFLNLIKSTENKYYNLNYRKDNVVFTYNYLCCSVINITLEYSEQKLNNVNINFKCNIDDTEIFEKFTKILYDIDINNLIFKNTNLNELPKWYIEQNNFNNFIKIIDNLEFTIVQTYFLNYSYIWTCKEKIYTICKIFGKQNDYDIYKNNVKINNTPLNLKEVIDIYNNEIPN